MKDFIGPIFTRCHKFANSSIISAILILSTPLLVLSSCWNGDKRFLKKMEEIDIIGNHDTHKAITMLDSLSVYIPTCSEYTRMKYGLLEETLRDKTYTPAKSDIKINNIVNYFDKHGTDKDKQEAYFYKGSAYRDLHDTPRAIKSFRQSVEIAKTSDNADIVLLRNAFSNLYFLYYNVQDYKNALKMAYEEYEISKEINNITAATIIHVAMSNMAIGHTDKAVRYLDEAYKHIQECDAKDTSTSIYTILYSYAYLGCKDKACNIYNNICVDKSPCDSSVLMLNSLAEYYKLSDKTDSAIICYEKIINAHKDKFAQYDASKALFIAYSEKGNIREANLYGRKFVDLTEQLDLGGKQELAATVNNEFQYHLDQERMYKSQRSQMMYRRVIIVGIAGFTIIILVFTLLYSSRRNKILRRLLDVSAELDSIRKSNKQLKEEMCSKEAKLSESIANIESNKIILRHMNEEIAKYTKLLEESQRQIDQKKTQNMQLLQILHQTELEASAEEIIDKVRNSANGKYTLSENEWRQLYTAVDQLYPTLRNKMAEELDSFTKYQMQVCYLICIGLTNPQIKNITDLPRTTIWRWSKAYEWAHNIG